MTDTPKNATTNTHAATGWSREVMDAVIAAKTQHREGHLANPDTPQQSLWQRFTHSVRRAWHKTKELIAGISDNVDPLNLFARIKDFYYLSRVVDSSSASGAQKGIKRLNDALGTNIDEAAAPRVSAALWDVGNGLVNMGISHVSNKSEHDYVMRVYGKAVRDELKLDRDPSYEEILKSKNPMVHRAAAYYKQKGFNRLVSDLPFFGNAMYVGINLAKNGGELPDDKGSLIGDLAKNSTYLGLFAKTIYHAWYFVFRFAGSFYQARNIWHATAAAESPEFQNKFADRKVFEFASGKDVFELQRWFASEEGHTPFSAKDPISKRIADRVAEYLNWTHLRPMLITDLLEKDKENGVVKGKQMEKEMEGITFRHQDLMNFIGFGGYQINEVRKSALRLEVFARQGLDVFLRVNEVLQQIELPHENDYVSRASYEAAKGRYEAAIDVIGKDVLGSKWPPVWFERHVDNLQRFGYPEIGDPDKTYAQSTRPDLSAPGAASSQSFAEKLGRQAAHQKRDITAPGIQSQPRTGMAPTLEA